MNSQQKLSLSNCILLGSAWVFLKERSDFPLTILLLTQSIQKKKYKQSRCVYAQVNQMVHVIPVRMPAFTEIVDMCMCVRQTI